jgi:cyclic pyranopterin phosphate synthase
VSRHVTQQELDAEDPGLERVPRDEQARWIRRVTVVIDRLDPAPDKITWRVGRGLHLLLHRPDRSYRHVEIRPREADAHAFARTATAQVRFTGEDPDDSERYWLLAIVASLKRVEREAGFARLLAWSETRPAPALPFDGRDRKHTSGDELLVRLLEPCQAACAFCSCRSSQPDMVASLSDVQQRLEDGREAGHELVAFTGGEPTLVKQLPRFISMARDLGYRKITIQTNGIKLADRAYVDELVEAGLTAVLQSLHSHEAAIHEAIFELPGCFEACVQGARNAVAAGLIHGLNHVTTRDNLAGLVDYVEFAHRELGTGSYITFSMMSPQGWGIDRIDLIPRISEFTQHLAPALQRAGELGIPGHVPGLCGVPLCTMPGFESHFLEYTQTGVPDLQTRSYGPECADCRWRSRCSGFWSDYLAHHGTDELIAV